MPSALDQLLGLRDDDDRFDRPPDELLPLQLEAAQERLDTRIDRIPLLRNRAESGGVSTITSPADLVPLLFAHNTYKTYGESWLVDGQWDRIAKWLSTVSTYERGDESFDDVGDLDAWVDRLAAAGRFVACSSGTTGKPAMLGAVEHDVDFAARANLSAFSWATGIPAAQDRQFMALGPQMKIVLNERIKQALIDGLQSPSGDAYQLPLPPISVGSVLHMLMLRRRILDGTAQPNEVADIERLAHERQAALDASAADAVDALVKHRDEQLVIGGMFQDLYQIATLVRTQGFSGHAFEPGNALLTGGGLKGAQLPADFREFVLGTFNVAEERVYHLYTMQELNTPFPACRHGRYHIAPWVIALPLDTPGEHLLDTGGEEIEARAAFFDLSLDGRWGGVITGDRVTIDFGQCSCGKHGPTVGRDIVRYSDLEGGDKITCAGTIDAYVSGAS